MEIKFVNPYNFVPLAGRKPGKTKETGEARLTGRIDYTLTTLTPLFIPNTSNDRIFGIQRNDGKPETDAEYHKNYDFFSYNDLSGKGEHSENKNKFYEPVIPGSEIRGAVRSLYEALTNSCLPSMQKPSEVSRRTPETYKAGILLWINGKIVLKMDRGSFPKNDLLYRDPVNKFNSDFLNEVRGKGFCDGDKIYFHRRERKKAKDLVDRISKEKNQDCREPGWLIIGMTGPKDLTPKQRKHCVHVFTEGTDIVNGLSPEQIEENLNACIAAYQGKDEHAYEDYKKKADAFFQEKTGGLPVYYSCIEENKKKHFYWSPACITREAYYHKLDECVKGYAGCTGRDSMCPACSLFGMMSQNRGRSMGSKIRFSDVTVCRKKEDGYKRPEDVNKQYYSQIVTLPELASPKIQATEFYLQKPEGVEKLMTWTYDYYIYLDKNNIPKIHWYSGDSDAPVISGRKFYWHSENGYKINVEEKKRVFKDDTQGLRTIRNQTVRPVKKGISFAGHVYFDGITEVELKQMTAIMNMSEDSESQKHYAIKLGAGKPIGMGSVDLKVNNIVCRYTEKGYREEKRSAPYNGFSEDLFPDSAALRYLDWDALKKNQNQKQTSGYLSTENWPASGAEGFNWFMKNRESFRFRQGSLKLENITKSPSQRMQVHFKEYLKPGQTELETNDLDHKEKYEVKTEEKTGSGQDSQDQVQWKKNDEVTGIVTKHLDTDDKKNSKIRLIVQYDDKKKPIYASRKKILFGGKDNLTGSEVEENFPVGTKVKVKCADPVKKIWEFHILSDDKT